MPRTIELQPLNDSPADWEPIEDEIRRVMRRELYAPLMKALGTQAKLKQIQNAKWDDVIYAIESGRIQYVRGHFEGRFSAEISKGLKEAGATWDRTNQWWSLPKSKLTMDMRRAIGTSESRFKAMAQQVDRALGSILPDDVAKKVSVEKLVDRALWRVNRKFDQNVRNVAIPPKFTDEQAARISRQYNDNMRLHIQGWIQDEIKKLRAEVSTQAVKGVRYESLVKTIQDSYDVSQSKAKFLARQETNLVMATIRKERFTGMGSQKYRWKCVAGSPNHPVRPYHKRLDNTVQLWSSPPIVDKNGNRKHPGEDYNCRCTAIPLLEV